MIPRYAMKLKAIISLGLSNVLAVAWYRVKFKSGYFEKSQPITSFDIFEGQSPIGGPYRIGPQKNEYCLQYFSSKAHKVGRVPEWNFDPYTTKTLLSNEQHWSKLTDFSLSTGDVKVLWEPSRFDWLIKSCWEERYSVSGTSIPIDDWLIDWCQKNPFNRGVNWKCAQEASIRVLHVLLAALIRHDRVLSPNPFFIQFLVFHLKRISPTVAYAKAQDNNHATTEATALFCIGAILESEGQLDATELALARKAQQAGRDLLEERVSSLILSDGAFSQYSTNYHRLMLDTVVFSECVRRFLNLREFSQKFYEKAAAASEWMMAMTDPVSGDAPNIGANDGAMLFNASSHEYRDFRPTCQAAQHLFCKRAVYQTQKHCLAEVFSKEFAMQAAIETSELKAHPLHTMCQKLGEENTFAILKIPHNRFRPAQSDALHLDFWHNGINLIRDAGTYTYNPKDSELVNFSSAGCHSTVEIDERDQMPKLSRFLYGEWLKPVNSGPQSDESLKTSTLTAVNEISSKYIDYLGASHQRIVKQISSKEWVVTDDVKGIAKSATLRFRLAPSEWNLHNNSLISAGTSITCSANKTISISLSDGEESRYYLQKNTLPVLEVKSTSDVIFTTRISLA